MLEELLNIGAVVGAIVPASVGLTEVIKRTFKINKRFVPLTCIVVGIGLCTSTMYIMGDNPILGIFGGIIAGLMGSGLYSGIKATAGK